MVGSPFSILAGAAKISRSFLDASTLAASSHAAVCVWQRSKGQRKEEPRRRKMFKLMVPREWMCLRRGSAHAAE